MFFRHVIFFALLFVDFFGLLPDDAIAAIAGIRAYGINLQQCGLLRHFDYAVVSAAFRAS